MSEAFDKGAQQRLLERLASLHYADQPSGQQRAALLRKLRHPRQRETVEASDPEEGPRKLMNRAGAALAAAACLLVGAAALWSYERTSSMSADRSHPTLSAPAMQRVEPLAPPVQSVKPAVRPCFLAAGTDGRLWSSTRAVPDLIRADGRLGRWMHQWPEGASIGMVPARVEPLVLPGAARGNALTAAGPRVSGWGTKLSAGLRVHLGASPDKVRFDCYDASKYAGVRFSARGRGIVFVLLQTVDSVPEELGGKCRDRCWFTSSHAFALSDEFRDFRLPWDQFNGPDTNDPAETHLTLLEFFVQPQSEPFEIALTNVAFMTRDEAASDTSPQAPMAPTQSGPNH